MQEKLEKILERAISLVRKEGSTKEIGGEWCEKNSKVTYEYWSTSYRTFNNSQGE